MAIEAVDENAAVPLLDPRLVVGISGPDVGAHLEDLGLAERRMQRVGRAQQLDRRAHADRALFRALDHRRADHELAVRPRHDIEGDARMQEAHRAGQRHLARPHADHLAAHAAQVRQMAARAAKPRQSTTTPALALCPSGCSPSSPNRRSRAARDEALGERVHRRARIEMALVGEEEPFAEAPGEIRLERGDRASSTRSWPDVRAAKRSISPASRGGATTSVPSRATPGTRASHQSIALWPSSTTLARRALALAERREHAAREPRGVAAEFAERSISATFAPRSASVSAVASPTTPAPTK